MVTTGNNLKTGSKNRLKALNVFAQNITVYTEHIGHHSFINFTCLKKPQNIKAFQNHVLEENNIETTKEKRNKDSNPTTDIDLSNKEITGCKVEDEIDEINTSHEL